jgi:hypothetical protein
MTPHGYTFAKSSRLLGGSPAIAFILLTALACRAAVADEKFAPETPSSEQARCSALGEGFYAVAGSNACIKISGYVAAGVDFAASGDKNSGPKSSGGFNTETAVGVDMRLDTPLGPGRLYVQFGHDQYRP